MIERLTSCRSCGSRELEEVLAYGPMPITAAMPTEEGLRGPQPVHPLTLAFCHDCSLLQIMETLPPDVLFAQDYPYFSSFADGVVRNAEEIACRMLQERRLTSHSLVMEPASNDGYLLQHYARGGVQVLGVDPVAELVTAAKARGVRSMQAFFGVKLARELRYQGCMADVLHANNVLAHQGDLNGFVEAVGTVLKPDGVAVVEVPYVEDLIAKCEFDTVYHEHLCYFSVTALDHLFRRHGLFINDIERIPIHGGSLRLFIEQRACPSDAVTELLRTEAETGMDRFDYYRDFSLRVQCLRETLKDLLAGIKAGGYRIAAYGAAAKGSTLINYFDIGRETIDFVVDRNTHKHGRFMPGKHIPILDTPVLLEEMPEYTLVLAWNFADEIMAQQQEYRRRGGRFIVPIPEPKVV